MEDLSGFSMLELFRLEADTQTASLSAGVLGIEQADLTAAAIEAMMRSAHSLKGAARIIGLEPAVRVAHALEEFFVGAAKAAFQVRPEHADVLLAAVDFLGAIARSDDALDAAGPWPERADRLVERLAALPTASTPAAAPPPDEPGLMAPSAAPAAAAVERSGPAEAGDRVVRVSADSLTRLVGLAGESLVESRHLRPLCADLLSLRNAQRTLRQTVLAVEERLATRAGPAVPPAEAFADLRRQSETVLAGLHDALERLEGFASRGEDLSGRLHAEAIASRMRPLADGIRGFPRLVRDVARTLGKQVRLDVRGDQTGVDRDILETLEAPLSHLVRNALDHGIESPDLRAAAGKPHVGLILIEAWHRAGALHIAVTDDGAGIDLERIRMAALARGLVASEIAERLSVAEWLEFLFLPGFSTKDTVSEISGRGVGLDAVQTMVKSVGGSLRVTTQPGRQTVFTMQLPITMSVIRAVVVEIAGEPYAFPLTRIDRILSCCHAAIRTVEGRQYVDHDGGSVGLVVAAQILGLQAPEPPASIDPLPVVVVSDRGRRYGVVVERLLGECDLEVRPLDRRLGHVPGVNSGSLLENGDPVLIIDVEDLVRCIEPILTGRRLTRVELPQASGPAPRRKRILVVDDSITVRELERQLLQARGFAVDVAVDGMEGWHALRTGSYDLVVSDVDMPRLDGIGMVSLMKADPATKDIPVVIVSYKDRAEDRLRGLRAGASRYLTKASFQDETFLHTIMDLIGEPTE